ncbi:MAG: hypothetical protein HOI95_01060, partial [Chromatiales bacterium]|nr:hypothetical protein [Chromatiales bacterium]
MHITQIAANVVDVGQGFMWAGRLAKQVIGVHVKIETNSGMAGHALCWPSELAPRAVAASIADTVAPLLVDTDPFDRVSALNPVWRSIRVGT